MISFITGFILIEADRDALLLLSKNVLKEGMGARGQRRRLNICIILIACINTQYIDCYCIKGLLYYFPLTSMIFIYSTMGWLMQIWALCYEVTVKSLILRWPLGHVDLFVTCAEVKSFEMFQILHIWPPPPFMVSLVVRSLAFAINAYLTPKKGSY